jgi:hypothetical protein
VLGIPHGSLVETVVPGLFWCKYIIYWVPTSVFSVNFHL